MRDTLRVLAFYLVIQAGLLLTMEIVVRIREPHPEELIFEWQAGLGIMPKPHQKKIHTREDASGSEDIEFITNSLGLRGEELDSKAETRIIVFGDSNVEALFSRFENTFPERLRQALSRRGRPKVEVVNAGVIGFGPDQALFLAERYAQTLRPDLMLFVVFADNDFGDLVRNRFFVAEPNGAVVRTTKFPVNDYGLTLEDRWSKPLRLPTYLYRKLGLEAKAQRETNYITSRLGFCEREYQTYVRGDADQINQFGDHYDFDLALFPDQPASQLKVTLMKAVIKEMANFSRKVDVPVALVVLPSVNDLSREVPDMNYTLLERRSTQYDRRRLSRIVLEAASSNQIPALDLYAHWMGIADHYYFPDGDNHWNNEGQRVAADLAADFILSRKLLRARSPRGLAGEQ